ncbi:unnamed protein product [Echinostoma caproni]|uniref:Uncharacterized protein n=1 Tax=Echinostoma caproni TaxID=27848 RepID=A0A183ADL4_9TREM|nr:unnamed protein product [Echinostoma caproni]
MQLIPTPGLALVTANGAGVHSRGRVALALELAEQVFTHTFLVALISLDVIVGTDLRNMHGAHIDAQQKLVSFTSVEELKSCSQVETRHEESQSGSSDQITAANLPTETTTDSSGANDANRDSQEKLSVDNNPLVSSAQMQSNWIDLLRVHSKVLPDHDNRGT